MVNVQNVVANRYLKERTNDPVNANLIPGIYSNTIIHVYSPRTGAGHHLVNKKLSQKKSRSLCISLMQN